MHFPFQLRFRGACAVAGAALLLVLSACGDSSSDRSQAGTQPASGQTASSQTAGTREAARAANLTGDPTCTAAGPHAVHISLFACSVCHPAGNTYGFTSPFTFPGGTTTAGGTIVPAGVSTTCTVACHYPKGATAHAVSWSTPGPLDCTGCHDTSLLPAVHPVVSQTDARATCTSCHVTDDHLGGAVVTGGHPVAWSDPTSPGFHAYSANLGLASCQGCHGTDLAGNGAAPSCGSCHDRSLPTGVPSWKVNCVMCHGGVQNVSGAPPKTTWGQSADAVRVGAHSQHLGPTALAPAFDCIVCHQKPTDALTPGHLDGPTATVAFGGVAASHGPPEPVWDRATGVCSNTYCHGGSLTGGTDTTPVWTLVGKGQAACGTCHGLPPAAPHPSASGLGSCVTCHPQTMTAAGTVIAPAAGGKHLDGVVEAAGSHGVSWMDTTSPGFHAYAANAGISACQGCHGPNLDGVGGTARTACADCHGVNWRTNCVMCHGGTDNQTGAPPVASWGGDGDPVRVGAHTKHVTAGAVASGFGCSACHVNPSDALSPGHLNGSTATVKWGGLALGGANPVLSGPTPAWDRLKGTCSVTYCHGNYTGTYDYSVWDWGAEVAVPMTATFSGGMATPTWTGGPLTCASCHGSPPAGNPAWHGSHGGGNGCDLCHPDADSTGTIITDPTKHVNGVVEVTPTYKSSCMNCH